MHMFRRVAITAMLIAATSLANAAKPSDDAATRDAQRAMFSVPAFGQGLFEVEQSPEGFDGETADQDALIAYLDAARQRGADLNAPVHLGTPLLHAIRAGFDRTARWLLAHGADPLRVTAEPGATARNGRDALELAVAYGRWGLLPVLRRHPAVAAQPAAEREQRIWRAAMAVPGRAGELLDRGEPMPRWAAGDDLAPALLTHALCSAQPRLALALLAAEPEVHPPPPPPPPAPLCPAGAAEPSEAPAAASAAAQWVALEQRLGWPLLPYALRKATSAADAGTLLHTTLARPWTQPGFARRIVEGALARRAGSAALLPLLHAMPEPTLQAVVQGMPAAWTAAAADWPRPELAWALAQVAPAALTAAVPDVARRWDGDSALAGRHAKDLAERDERWRLLSQRMAGTPPAAVSPLFLYGVPRSVWPRWFDLGFRVADEDWAAWLDWAPLAELRAAWPIVAPRHPHIAQRSLTWLVAPLVAGPTTDPVAARRSYSGNGCCFDIEKGRFLAAQGLKVQPPRPLAAAYREQPARDGDGQPGNPTQDPGARAALAAGWVLQPLPAERLAAAPTRCKPRITPAMRRSLAGPIRAGDAEGSDIDPATLQWIDAPQGEECVYFVDNGGSGGRLFIDDESFDGGANRLTPCPDNQRRVFVWRPRAGTWAPLDWSGQGEVQPVRLPGGGVGLVQLEMDFGTCGAQAGLALRWRPAADGDGWLWEPAPADDALQMWLVQHCDLRAMGDTCLETTPQPAANAPPPTPAIERLLAAERAQFLAAIDTMDRDALAASLRDGLFPAWVHTAIAKLSANVTMPLAEKRRRMAWLLARHEALQGLDLNVLDGLVAWLPTEDWPPLQRYRLCQPDGAGEQLAKHALALGRADLDARLRASPGRACGS
jgi:hypothetical protein